MGCGTQTKVGRGKPLVMRPIAGTSEHQVSSVQIATIGHTKPCRPVSTLRNTRACAVPANNSSPIQLRLSNHTKFGRPRRADPLPFTAAYTPPPSALWWVWIYRIHSRRINGLHPHPQFPLANGEETLLSVKLRCCFHFG